MAKFDPTVTAITAAAVLSVVASVMLNQMPESSVAQQAGFAAHAADGPQQRPTWAASATGRVEPKLGEIRISAEVPAKVAKVLVTATEAAVEGDLLVRLDSGDLFAKLSAAEAEAQVRVRERDEEVAKGLPLERRQAEDQVAATERALFKARMELDAAIEAANDGKAEPDVVRQARDKVKAAVDKLVSDRANYATVAAKPDMPLPTRLESSLTQARADVTQVETAINRTRIRAPSDGTALTVWARPGEMSGPSSEAPLLLYGDLTSLRVRAEVEERDTPKLRVGQRVVVRSEAYEGKDFEGTVTQVGQALGAPRITSRGPRRPNDVEVLEVLIALDGTRPSSPACVSTSSSASTPPPQTKSSPLRHPALSERTASKMRDAE